MKNCIMYMVIVISIMSVISLVDAQAAPPCAIQLLPCMDYLNSTTKPPNSCCNPIKDLDEADKTCFCQLALTPGLLEGFGVKISQAFKVLHSCDVNFDITFCKASSPTLSPSSRQPPATPGSDEGGSGRITLNGLCFILFIWAFVLFH